MLQLGLFINYQNGSLIDAVKMWQRNADKTFEGVEECSVCYAVLHDTTYKMPKTVRLLRVFCASSSLLHVLV